MRVAVVIALLAFVATTCAGAPATVTVNYSGSTKAGLNVITNNEGTSVTFSATVTGGTSPYTNLWQISNLHGVSTFTDLSTTHPLVRDSNILFTNPSSGATATIQLQSAYATYEKYRFRLKSTDNGGNVGVSDPFWFRYNTTSLQILQNSQSSVSSTKKFSVFWNPPDMDADYPAFKRDLIRISKSNTQASQFLAVRRFTATDPISGDPIFVNELEAPAAATVDSYWTVVSDYVTLTFDGASSDGSDLEGWIQAGVEAACVVANPGKAFRAYFQGYISSVGSTRVTVYVRNYNTGTIMTKASLISALTVGSGLGTFASGVSGAGLPFTTYSVSGETFSTFLSTENFFLQVTSDGTLTLAWAPYVVTADADSFLFNVLPSADAIAYTEAAAFVGGDRFRIQSVRAPTKYVGITTGSVVTLLTNATDPQGLFVRSSSDVTFLTDTPKTDTWAGSRCATNKLESTAGSQVAQNVDDCAQLPDNPTYRRLEIDLGGEFFVTTVSITMPNRPFALEGDAEPFTIVGVSLWGKQRDASTFIQLNQTLTTSTCSSATSTCTFTFAVGTFSRTKLKLPGNRGFRWLRLIFDGMDVFNDRVPESARYFALSDVAVTGNCLCNGHSKFCNLQTAACTEYDTTGSTDSLAKTCSHNTRGLNCDECDFANNVYINPRNKPPTDAYNCNDDGTNCDGPKLPEYNPTEIEARNSGGKTIAANNFLFFQLMFPQGPCIPCFCYGHNELEVGVSDKSCNAFSGVCTCASTAHNVTGNSCENCVQGWCRNCNSTDPATRESCRLNSCSLCNCNQHSTTTTGSGADLCNPDGCGCTCKEGDHVEGAHCENCKKGYFNTFGNGLNGRVCNACECNGHKAPESNECEANGGSCMKDKDGNAQPCHGNTEGDHCQYCKPGFYRPIPEGKLTVNLTDDCIPCSCNQHGDAKSYTGLLAGTAICDPEGGVCNCKASDHVEGDNCEKCVKGYWSAPGDGKDGVSCTACTCNGHKATSGNECEAKGGNCMNDYSGSAQPCEDETQGSSCDECKDGFYRECQNNNGYPVIVGLSKTCTVAPTQGCVACGCNGHHPNTVPDTVNDPLCEKVGGDCPGCLDNTEGAFCENCKPNYFNEVGDGKDSRKCEPCACYNHSSTCNSTGWCSGCGDNTRNGGLGKCDLCEASYKRDRTLHSTYDMSIPADVDNIRFEKCSSCNCNTHSTRDPTVDDGICEEINGHCYDCGGHTVNGDTFECERCESGYFRNLDAIPDTCTTYDSSKFVYGHNNTARTLESDCLPCDKQCFGAADECTETTGECTDCDDDNATGVRCEVCAAGYFGSPADGIPCRPCRCYHSVDSTFASVTAEVITDALRCQLDAGVSRKCFLNMTIADSLDQSRLKDVNDDLIYTAIQCACPREPVPFGGQFNKTDGTIYYGATCDKCNNAAYYGKPTLCETDAAGTLATCSSFDTCNPCNCNGNIDQSQAITNCLPSTDDPQCKNCLGHTTGDKCQNCETGYYGDATRQDVAGEQGTGYVLDNSGDSLKCFKCDCNGVSVTRFNGLDGIAGDVCESAGSNNEGNYTCTCDESRGYTGAKCRKCKRGYQLKTGYNATNFADPLYDYCEPCPQCVLDVYTFSIDPLESGMKVLESDVVAVNSSIQAVIDSTANILSAVASVKTGLDNSLSSIAQSLTNADNDLTSSLNVIASNLADQRADLTAHLAQQASDITNLGNAVTTLAAAVANAKTVLENNIANLQSDESALSDRANDLSDATTNLQTTVSNALTALTTAASSLSSKVDDIQEELQDASDSVAATIAALELRIGNGSIDVTDFGNNVENRRQALLDELAELKTKIDDAVDTFDNKFTLLDARITASVAELEQYITANSDRITSLATAAAAAEARADEVKTAVDGQKDAVAGALDTLRANITAQVAALSSAVDAADEALTNKVSDVIDALSFATRAIEDKLIEDLWPTTGQADLSDFQNVPNVVSSLNGGAAVLCGRGGSGSAIVLPGRNNSYGIIPAASAFSDLSSGITVSVWVRQAVNNDGYILSKSTATGATRYFSLWSEGSRNRFHLFFLPATSTTGYRQSTITLTTPIDDNTPHHVVVVVTSTVIPRAFLYVDGVQVGEFPNIVQMTEKTGLSMYVGARAPIAFTFNGTLDQLHIHPRDLSGKDIVRIFNMASVADSPVAFTLVEAPTHFNQTAQSPIITYAPTAEGFVTPVTGFTLSAWVKQAPSDDAYIFSKADAATGNQRSYSVYLSSLSSELGIYYRTLNTTNWRYIKGADVNIADDKFHHIAVTVDRTNAAFYVDGVLRGTGQLAGIITDDITQSIYVARRPQSPKQMLTGSLSRTRLYFNQALCESSIKTFFAEGSGSS